MDAVYDRSGNTVGWMSHNELQSLTGHVIGFVRNKTLYSRAGHHVGSLVKGNFIDRRGRVVAWIAGAEGGPEKPSPRSAPQPGWRVTSGTPGFGGVGGQQALTTSWSTTTLESLLIE
jgi:hypothetical protein